MLSLYLYALMNLVLNLIVGNGSETLQIAGVKINDKIKVGACANYKNKLK